MSHYQPVAWMVYTQDGQSCYVTDNPADVLPNQRALPLYTEPFPTATHPAITHCDTCGCDWLDNGLNPIGCPYCKQSAEAEALRAEVKRLRADLAESDEIREKLGHLLTRTAAALKGEPPEGVWHSWHDLPEKAAQLVEALRGWWEARRPVGWTEDQHRSCPHVNLVTNAEKALADAMLKVKAREASND